MGPYTLDPLRDRHRWVWSNASYCSCSVWEETQVRLTDLS